MDFRAGSSPAGRKRIREDPFSFVNLPHSTQSLPFLQYSFPLRGNFPDSFGTPAEGARD